jgi:hypothetical protein
MRPPWLRWLGPRCLLGAALALYALGCIALTRWRMVRRGWPLTFGLAAVAAASGLAVAAYLTARAEHGAAERLLVVIAEDGVLLRRGNGTAYPPRYEAALNRGVEARLRFARGDWLQIELPSGEVGWVPRSAVLVDDGERT